jgi:hypothetical protein
MNTVLEEAIEHLKAQHKKNAGKGGGQAAEGSAEQGLEVFLHTTHYTLRVLYLLVHSTHYCRTSVKLTTNNKTLTGLGGQRIWR